MATRAPGLAGADVDPERDRALGRLSDIVLRGARELTVVLTERARARDTVCVGRTHGVHAEPTTFGVKQAWDTRTPLRELLEAQPQLPLDLGAVVDLSAYTRHAADIAARIVAERGEEVARLTPAGRRETPQPQPRRGRQGATGGTMTLRLSKRPHVLTWRGRAQPVRHIAGAAQLSARKSG